MVLLFFFLVGSEELIAFRKIDISLLFGTYFSIKSFWFLFFLCYVLFFYNFQSNLNTFRFSCNKNQLNLFCVFLSFMFVRWWLGRLFMCCALVAIFLSDQTKSRKRKTWNVWFFFRWNFTSFWDYKVILFECIIAMVDIFCAFTIHL